MAAMLARSSSLLLLVMALWTSSCLLLPAAMAENTVHPASSSAAAVAAAQPSIAAAGKYRPTTTGTLPAASSSSSAPAAVAVPPGTPAAASEPATTATAGTAPEKFPLPTPHGGVEPDLPAPHGGGEPYLPAAQVAGALPVPTPDELPSGASLGFGSNGGLGFGGPGDECCGGGGNGWFGGPGGFGPGTYGYNGPLYWGAAPAAAGLGRVINVVLPLVITKHCVGRFGTVPVHRSGQIADKFSLSKFGVQRSYILVLSNLLTGPIPPSYAECTPLLRFRVSNNHLEGDVPPGIFGLPHASIVDLNYNHFTGPVAATVAGATNLTSLFASNNQMSGVLPPEIAGASGLVKIDLSNNLIAGPIPASVGLLSKLNQLSLQGNRLNGSIPETLAGLKTLNVLNLSDNALSGEIPESLCKLLPNSLDFSNNNLSGPVPLQLIKEGLLESVAGNPGLCVAFRLNLTDPALPLCPRPSLRRGLAGDVWVVGVCALVCAVAMLALARRWVLRARRLAEQDGALASSPGSSASYDVTSFHKLTFDQHEILEALIDKNIVGHGGSGTVYKIELSSGELVAVKKLWVSTRRLRPPSRKQVDWAAAVAMTNTPTSNNRDGGWLGDRELRTEVETLGSIRHKNIVKLYCCYSSADCNLLVYEYMPNGNLWEALHGCYLLLDWPTRHRVALGVAQGLAYLHHDLLFPIVHRDIKSSNILLDADFEPKVADFGIAKVLQARGGADRDGSTTTIAGTYGYLAPEYAYSSKATTKCDVYSFGVVLMELATGRKPIEPEFGDTRDIVHWVSGKVAAGAGAEADALDKRLAWSPYKEEMVQALRVAVRCTCSMPALRPTMADVVQMLAEAGPPAGRTTKNDKDDKDHHHATPPP
ncbi:unnamed protein product [Miscanthus lutarioriparius]|uniref:Protein kinase domain-containing protein n=1 Tax=Miscanthus lutarioriparius TaxID=422564 RepID=A0A811RHV6_9POAL|nr:unnamed protein product [Miscanthus lutarioriparius]